MGTTVCVSVVAMSLIVWLVDSLFSVIPAQAGIHGGTNENVDDDQR